MFVTYHMASLASSSLLVGYHQDVNLGAHIITMDSTYVSYPVWNEMARIVYDLRWKSKYNTYEEWLGNFAPRCREMGIDMYSGRSLYSTLLPEDMEWSMGAATISKGILTKGLLGSSTTSGSSGSIGMIMYRTYGSRECVSWLNASYRMLNLYLIQRGATLGFPHLLLSKEQNQEINLIKQSVEQRKDLQLNTDSIIDPTIRARTESEITQELSNARETVSVIVMNPQDMNATLNIKGKVYGDITLYRRAVTILSPGNTCKENQICLEQDPLQSIPEGFETRSVNETVKGETEGSGYSLVEEILIPSPEGDINEALYNVLPDIQVDLYTGLIRLTMDGETYSISMGIFPRIAFNLITTEIQGNKLIYKVYPIDRTYTLPNPLRMMIESGARGNATNAIQIAGIIGQLTYAGGRIPDSLESGQTANIAFLNPTSTGFKNNTGKRSMPCYEFGGNTPKSRGFIDRSYIQGMDCADYMASHVASRENLTSNTDLTPRTGYFERRVRTFTENLRISYINGRQVVTNERGIVVMWDYLLDPSRVFSINRNTTFVDISYELRHLKNVHTKKAVFIYIGYKENMRAYLSFDRRLHAIIGAIQGADVVIGCDSRIEGTYPEYYEYLRNILPSSARPKDSGKVMTISLPPGMSTEWALELAEYKDGVIVIPLESKAKIDMKSVNALISSREPILPLGVSARINISSSTIYGISYPSRSGQKIPVNILIQMMTLGTEFAQYPYVISPSIGAGQYVRDHSLLETLILSGDIIAI